MNDTLQQCRHLLAVLTPLHNDCGLVCGGACCRSHEGEETGMLLFPGEETLYLDKPGWRVADASGDRLLICSGTCDRAMRPLSCRMFPLLPLLREDGIHVVTDARAMGTCPLRRDGLDPAFVQAVGRCGLLLAENPAQRPVLERLTAIHDELKTLQRQFR